MNDLVRRLSAAVVAVTLVALVACDLWVGSVRAWWDRHSLTGSVVSSLLVLAVTALIVDEVLARRQRKERASSVAVQGLIVYGQARRAYAAVIATGTAEPPQVGAREELRTLATMMLTASPSLFDDPAARRFLEQVERFSVSMIRELSALAKGELSRAARERLEDQVSQLQVTVEPLLARIPTEDRSALEGWPYA
ncbi:MAG: hypothetical protein ABSB54_14535 [Acidimicrobiales bacterium]